MVNFEWSAILLQLASMRSNTQTSLYSMNYIWFLIPCCNSRKIGTAEGIERSYCANVFETLNNFQSTILNLITLRFLELLRKLGKLQYQKRFAVSIFMWAHQICRFSNQGLNVACMFDVNFMHHHLLQLFPDIFQRKPTDIFQPLDQF